MTDRSSASDRPIPLTFATVAGLLLVTGVAASYFPARRAVSLDPVQALRLK